MKRIQKKEEKNPDLSGNVESKKYRIYRHLGIL